VSTAVATAMPFARLGLFVPVGLGSAGRAGRAGPAGPAGPPGTTFDEVLALAAAAEHSGFDSIWVPDHPYAAATVADPLEAYTVLGALAAKTTRIRVAAMGPSAIARGPGMVVKQVTALDVLSGGRAILGLAPQPWVSAAPGHPKEDALAERATRFGEALDVCRALLDSGAPAPPGAPEGEGVTYNGSYYSLSRAVNRPRPVQPGGIPIVIPVSGADADSAVLDLAVRHAAACVIVGGDSHLQATIDELRRRCTARGRDPTTLPVLHVGPVTTVERLQAVRALGVDGVIVVLDDPHPDTVERIGGELGGVLGGDLA